MSDLSNFFTLVGSWFWAGYDALDSGDFFGISLLSIFIGLVLYRLMWKWIIKFIKGKKDSGGSS